LKKIQKNQKMNLVEENTSYQKVNEKVGKRKKILLKKFHLCRFCRQVFIKNHQQLENHLKKFHSIGEENFHQIFDDIEEICCQTNSNEAQVGKKKKVLLKKFHLCRFCRQVFIKNHQQLEDHLKNFHSGEENFHQIFDDIEEICCQTNSNEAQNQSFTTNISNIKSNELIEEIFSKKKTPKIIIRKLDDSDRKSKLNAKRRSMKCIQKKINICYQTNSNEAQNQNFTTNISNIKSNELIEEIFSKKKTLKIIIRKLDGLDRKSKLNAKKRSMKSIHLQTKLINENLSREKMDKAEIPNVKSIKKRNSTTSNEKRKIRCLPSISIKSESQPRKKEKMTQNLQ
jgi:hypothetical protein